MYFGRNVLHGQGQGSASHVLEKRIGQRTIQDEPAGVPGTAFRDLIKFQIGNEQNDASGAIGKNRIAAAMPRLAGKGQDEGQGIQTAFRPAAGGEKIESPIDGFKARPDRVRAGAGDVLPLSGRENQRFIHNKLRAENDIFICRNIYGFSI